MYWRDTANQSPLVVFDCLTGRCVTDSAVAGHLHVITLNTPPGYQVTGTDFDNTWCRLVEESPLRSTHINIYGYRTFCIHVFAIICSTASLYRGTGTSAYNIDIGYTAAVNKSIRYLWLTQKHRRNICDICFSTIINLKIGIKPFFISSM